MQKLQSWAKNFNNNLAACFITILGMIFTGIIIYAFTREGLDFNFIHNTFAVPDYLFVSEKSERLTYIINTLLFIPLFYLSFTAIKKYFNPKDDIKLLNKFSALTGILLVVLLFISIPFALHFYFDISLSFIFENCPLILLLLFASCACYYLKIKYFLKDKSLQ